MANSETNIVGMWRENIKLQQENQTLRHQLDHVMTTHAGKGEQLLAIVHEFIRENRIYCVETIHQTDRVIENAYYLIQQLCDVVGYLEDDDGII